MASNDLPTRPPSGGLDRSAVERVLARASQLQNSGGGEPNEQISETQLYEIAKEVGLSAESINQALAEERTHLDLGMPAGERGWITSIAGPNVVSAQRIVGGDTLRAMGLLDRWMQDGECLNIQRQFPDRMVWEPRKDFAGIMKRAWKVGGYSYHLSDASAIAATVVPIEGDEARVLVRLDADVRPSRTKRLAGGGVVAGGGFLIGSSLAVFGSLFHVPDLGILAISLIPFAGAATGGYAIARTQLGVVARVKLGLEQAIDKLEYGTSHVGPARLDTARAPLLPR